ncbi:hypothetical protein ACXYTP_07815 [Tsukamurella ocularis]|uniref:hypothetical protein n=1 Tax=Tsukamurella ocularis TaxID=1970234 RepID=UPI0039F04A18
MSAKHRRATRLAAKRTAIAAGALGATASISLMGAPAQAATTAPDYSKAISDYSHALDNFLNAANNVTNSAGSVWNPIAAPTGGILPTFGSSYTKVDVTKISSLPDVLRNIAGLNLPTGVPGVVPNVVLPGGGQLDLSKILPTSMPGGALLNGAATVLDGALGLPVIGPYIDRLPALSEIVSGLTATQSKYTSSYAWKLLQLSGTTNVLNTFVQTPSGLALKQFTLPTLPGLPGVTLGPVTILPEGSLPSGTVWLPQADGTYTFPLGAKAGFWGAAPTAAVKIPNWLGGSETVASVPIGAAGVELPLGLAKAGVLGANVLLPTQNGVYSPIGLTMTNVNTILPVGFTNINVTTGNYVGTNGINVNNGQNLLLLQNPLGVPLPILYGLGGFNFGVEGAGLTSPSLFGVKLFSDDLLQLGSKTGPNSSAGLIPPGILPTDPLSQIITGVTSPLGVSSLTQLLGIDAFIKPVMTAFGPVYQAVSAVTLKPLSDFATSQYGPFINGSAAQLLDLSKTLSEQSTHLPGAPAQSAADANTTADKTGGAHRAENGGTLVSTLLARDTGVEQVQSTADASRPATTSGSLDADSGTTAPPVTPTTPPVETPTQTPDPTPPAETPTTETPAVETPAVPASEPEAEATEPATAPAETTPSSTDSEASTDSDTPDAGADKAA